MTTVKSISRRAFALGTTALAAIGLLPLRAYAAYPDKAIKIVVPYTPGGATDLIGRIVAQKLSVALGQPVIVDNKAGAAGNLGAAAVAKEAADGYTSPDEAKTAIRDEVARWSKIIKDSNIKPD